ncbi:MAG: SUMF1/EgtB/PvdO family nonheme iron enzyme [Phaeodactylibacter xiamenensis]|uniref:SUMF1/EgtB/PvdO family nonheme iron enzyme n=1 Tax=Phaeodactylibacter xiamenensis TaxID=1524460 RepID=UPI0006991C3B|nr:SUMF1/EgtB/PvdO family nonheme iron enzyme [Phaeodactylibacter xiamenensis]MCR9051204.1 SUMF1/EgtB/PvdO family nonheme iron enzyme [bacterium]
MALDLNPEINKRTNHFLGIGIDEYIHCENLHCAVKDIKDFRAILEENFYFDAVNICLLLDEEATRLNIIKALEGYAKKLTNDDNLIIYFAGHGTVSSKRNGKGYWIPVDGGKDSTGMYLSNSRIKELLEEISAHHILLISDACFSASIAFRNLDHGKDTFESLDRRPSRWVIASGQHDEPVVDKIGANSPFARGLQTSLLDADVVKINTQQLADKIFHHTNSQTTQTPIAKRLNGDKGGQFIFEKRISPKDYWQQTIAENTLDAYRKYLSLFPETSFAVEAREQINKMEEAIEWKQVLALNSINAYNEYLVNYPNGRFYSEALKRLRSKEDDAAWALIQRTGKFFLLHQYRADFPDGKYTEQVNEMLKAQLSESDEATATKPKELIKIEGGSYWRGGGTHFKRSRPKHLVQIDSFLCAPFLVTFEEYDRFCQEQQQPLPDDKGWGRGNRPAIQVSWYQAIRYCNWLSQKSGFVPVYTLNSRKEVIWSTSANGYRLLTEAEWEYAARGGLKSKGYPFAGGNQLNELAWYEHNSSGQTQPVGLKQPNELGLYDMSGNCYEWVYDRWEYRHYKNFADKVAINPTGPEEGPHRVVRGGAFNSDDDFCRSIYREDYHPGRGKKNIGFRLARTE